MVTAKFLFKNRTFVFIELHSQWVVEYSTAQMSAIENVGLCTFSRLKSNNNTEHFEKIPLVTISLSYSLKFNHLEFFLQKYFE